MRNTKVFKHLTARQLMAIMRKKVPTQFPCTFGWGGLGYDVWADCTVVTTPSRRFHIRLSKGLRGSPGLCEMLMHEYAHAVAWEVCLRCSPDHEHPAEFWIALGRVYGAVMKEVTL